MKINIIGASVSGTTTLAERIAVHLGFVHLDSDEYFWEKTEEPFEKRRDPELRNSLLDAAIESNMDIVLSGPFFHWNDDFTDVFNLVIFLYVPQDIRMNRLRRREYERYGDAVETNELKKMKYQAFMEWAASYDDPLFESTRTLHQQREWLDSLQIPILKIEGNYLLEPSTAVCLDKIKQMTS
ncbi:adenylate kinase family enzyme [Chryseobacterium sp. H1D6B]|uniref:AAA family ATPase n=1 Tax=Chryseobacterium sp. H1D6B TaxID=2940588 RepID=UPI0015CA12DE|nr:AAA family ATPase [Chryseobacterium sp. H1D6B]MDH6250294.1 adenylate kinase family enzyme [Chryseobacterium sp. H1D6B]